MGASAMVCRAQALLSPSTTHMPTHSAPDSGEDVRGAACMSRGQNDNIHVFRQGHKVRAVVGFLRTADRLAQLRR